MSQTLSMVSGFPVSPRRGKHAAFTLIEMLVVMALITIIMALAVPSFLGTIQSSRLTAAGQNMLGRLAQAQQTATSTNVPVEVRFYQYSDQTSLNKGNYFSAYQFLLVNLPTSGNGTTTETMSALSSPFYLEPGIYIMGNAMISGNQGSPLLTGNGAASFSDNGLAASSGIPVQITRAAAGAQATYIAIRFYPDGTVKRLGSNNTTSDTNLGGASVRTLQTLSLPDAYFTIVGEKDVAGGDAVHNYYAIQLDPYTGHARAYQPGL
jgi:uncharacterized protein (TIGR02596 family)